MDKTIPSEYVNSVHVHSHNHKTLMLQAVYGAFARFRAHHRLRTNASCLQTQSAVTETETAAVSMLQHVAATAGADDIAPGGLRSLPSQQSGSLSLASAEAQQGSGNRSLASAAAQAVGITAALMQYVPGSVQSTAPKTVLTNCYKTQLEKELELPQRLGCCCIGLCLQLKGCLLPNQIC